MLIMKKYIETDGCMMASATDKQKDSLKECKSESHIKQVELGSRKISLDLLISLIEVLNVDANSILGESSDHKDNSIDAKLQELPEPQRQYFTTMFLTMLANYPAAA